jgi:hypothetical protein
MGTRTRTVAIAAALAATTALFAVPAQAGTSFSLSIHGGDPYAGYVYQQPGYVHSQPSYVYTQPGYVYSQPSYIYYDNGHRQHRHRHHNRGWGHRDRDHDGVPNRFDRRPNNPYRY